PHNSDSSKPSEPSEPPEPPGKPDESEPAETKGEQAIEAEVSQPVEPEDVHSNEQPSEQEAAEPASDTVHEANESQPPQLEKVDVAADTHPISTSEGGAPADVQGPDAPNPSTEESKPDASEQDPSGAGETNGEHPGESNDQETTPTIDEGAISEPQAGEAVDKSTVEPEKLKDTSGDVPEADSIEPQNTAPESTSDSNSGSAAAVEKNESSDTPKADTETVEESGTPEQSVGTQKVEIIKETNEALADGKPADGADEKLEKSKDHKDPSTELSDENATTGGVAPTAKDDLSGEAIKSETSNEPEPPEVSLESPEASQNKDTATDTNEPAAEPQEQADKAKATDLPEANENENQPVVVTKGIEDVKEVNDTTNTEDMPATQQPEGETTDQTEKHSDDSAPVEKQEQADASEHVAKVADSAATDASDVPAIPLNEDLEKLSKPDIEPAGEATDLKVPDEAVPSATGDASDGVAIEPTTGEPDKSQEPEIAPDQEAKEPSAAPEQTATESLPAPEPPADTPAPDAVPAQDEPSSQESALETSAPEEPVPPAPTSEEASPQNTTSEAVALDKPASVNSDSQDPVSEETISKEPVSEESVTPEPASQEAMPEESVPKDPVSQESTAPTSETPVPSEAAPEEIVSKAPPQENAAQDPASEDLVAKGSNSEESATKEPILEEPISEESVSQEAVSEDTVSKEIESQEPAAEEPAKNSGSQDPSPEKADVQEPVSEEPSSQESMSKEADPKIPEDAAPQKPSPEGLTTQDSDSKEPVVEEAVPQEIDSKDSVSQDTTPEETVSQEQAPRDPATNDQSLSSDSSSPDESAAAPKDEVKTLPEKLVEETGETAATESNLTANDGDEHPNSELLPASTDKPTEEPIQGTNPPEPAISNENNQSEHQPEHSGSGDEASTAVSSSEDGFVVIDKSDSGVDGIADNSEQKEELNDEETTDSLQQDTKEEPQSMASTESSIGDPQGKGKGKGKGKGSSTPAETREPLENDHDANSPSADADIVNPVESSLPEDTTPSGAEEHQPEAEKQDLDQNVSIQAEKQAESDESVETPKDEENTALEPNLVDVNAEASEPKIDSEAQVTDTNEEAPTHPNVSSPEVTIESEEPDSKDDADKPSPNVEGGVEGDASVEHAPDSSISQSAPADEATGNNETILESKVSAPNDVPLGKSESESDLNETAPVIEIKPSPIASTEPELLQKVDDKEIPDDKLVTETESTPQALLGDPVEKPAGEAEKQPDPISPPEEDSSEKKPEEPAKIADEGDQPVEQVLVSPETEEDGGLQPTESSDPGQEQSDSPLNLAVEDSGQPNEEKPERREEGGAEEQNESGKSSPETPAIVEAPPAITEDQTNMDQAELDTSKLAESTESLSQQPADNAQSSEAEDKEGDGIGQTNEQAPASSPVPTKSPTEPPKSLIHENDAPQDIVSQDLSLTEDAKPEPQPVEQDSDAHKDSGSGASPSDSEHEPAAVEQPEPEHELHEAIQEKPTTSEKGITEDEPVSNEQIVVEQTSTASVDNQPPAETQDSQENAAVELTSTEETTKDHPDANLSSEIPVPDQSQEEGAKDADGQDGQDGSGEPAIAIVGKVDEEPQSSESIQGKAPAESQIPADLTPTEGKPAEDKTVEDKPTEDQVIAEDQAPVEETAPVESNTPAASSDSNHADDVIPAAVDLSADEVPESEQQPQKEAEAAEPSDQVTVTQPPVDIAHESDKVPAASEPVEDHIPHKSVSESNTAANNEENVDEEPKQELPSSAAISDALPADEKNEARSSEDNPTGEPNVVVIQDNNKELDDSSPDSTTGGQVLPQESELSSEVITQSQPPEIKETEATSVNDKATPEEPEVVHTQDSQGEEAVAVLSESSIKDPTISDEAKSLPNTSSAETTRSIITVLESPADDSIKQGLAQETEDHATDKDIDNVEQREVPRDDTPVPLAFQDLPKNDDDKTIDEVKSEPEKVQPTESSEPTNAEAIVKTRVAPTDDSHVAGVDETPLSKDSPAPRAEGDNLPVITEDLATPFDEKVDRKAVSSPVAKPEEAESSAKQPRSGISVPEQTRGKEDDVRPTEKVVPKEPLRDDIVRDHAWDDEKVPRTTSGKAILVERVIKNQLELMKAPKEYGRATERVKVKKIRSDDESKDTVGPIPTDREPVQKGSKGEDQLFSSFVGDTPVVGAIDFHDTPESFPERLFSVEGAKDLKEDDEYVADVPEPTRLGRSLAASELSPEPREDIETSHKSLTENYPGMANEQSWYTDPAHVLPLEVHETTKRDRSPRHQDSSSEDMEASLTARPIGGARTPSPIDDTASPQVQDDEGIISEILEELGLNIRSDSRNHPRATADISDDESSSGDIKELADEKRQETRSSQPATVSGASIHHDPLEKFHDSSFVNISSVDLKTSQELPFQELGNKTDYDLSASLEDFQSDDGEAISSKLLESDENLSKEASAYRKFESIPPDTTEALDITTASDIPSVPRDVEQPLDDAGSARHYSGMVKAGIFKPTAFSFLGRELARRHLVKNDDEQAASSRSLDSREVPVETPAEPKPITVSTDLSQLEDSIISLPDEGSEEPSSPERLSKPADPVGMSVPTKDESDHETEVIRNDSPQQAAEFPELSHVIAPESLEIVASTIPLSESFTVVEKTQIPQKSSKRTPRPSLVHSGTQTEDDFDSGSQPSWSFINIADLDPRSRTPGIILPDPTDSKAKALGRAKSVRKRRRQTLRQAEEAVATAVILYATAQGLGPSSSSLLGSARIENDIGGTLESTQKDVQEADGFSSSDFVAGNQSVGQNDYSLPVADLSTDDEEKKSADELRHRHRRHHHRHHRHHSSRSKDTKDSGEHLHPRNTRIESSHSVKSSSDRSIPQTPKRDSGFSVESSRTTGSSGHHRRRTPEEQAAHERRKEERRAAREAYERTQEGRGKDPETPTSDRHSSHRSSRRHSTSHSEKSHAERHSERSQPEKYSERRSERSQPEKYPERSFSERYAERPQSERYSEQSHSERYPAKDSTSSSNKRFFDVKNGESSIAPNYVPRTRSNSTNVPPPVLREPSKSGPLKRSNTGRSSRNHAGESGEIPRPRSHRSHGHDYEHEHEYDPVHDDSSKRRRSEAKASGSVESTSSKAAHLPPPSPTKDEHRQSRQRERQRAREAAEAAEAKKKSGGIRAAFKKLFS
ncbi:hypothetical protein F4811DRAFT_538312, partial [Daldinia bambusicola]